MAVRAKASAAAVTSLAAIGVLGLLVPSLGLEPAGAEKPAPAAPVAYGPPRELAKLADPEITESSGLACSRVNDGVFWTHNDSGSTPRVFAFNSQGESVGTFEISGAHAVDWEDMASFKQGKNGFLVIGDVGDNNLVRKGYAIYLVPEPVLPPKAKGIRATLKALPAIRFTYEDGPHNCESVGIDPTDKAIYLVSKMPSPVCKVYVLPLPTKGPATGLVAKAIATLSIPTTTAMDISPDGLRAVVLTYGDAYEYARAPKEKWADAFGRPPRRLPMPGRAQGETLCYGPDGKTLYLTSERLPVPLLEVPMASTHTGSAANSGVPQPEERRPLCDRVLPAGQESAINEYLGDHTAGKDAAAFANPLDQAFAVLVARAWPAPEPMAMAEGAVAALCEEFRRQGGGDVSAEDRREWASTAARPAGPSAPPVPFTGPFVAGRWSDTTGSVFSVIFCCLRLKIPEFALYLRGGVSGWGSPFCMPAFVATNAGS